MLSRCLSVRTQVLSVRLAVRSLSAIPARPSDVGISAMEVYFPRKRVSQTDLETFDGVSPGKYTLGLGQTNMAYATDREDINSICMTAVKRLLERNNIDPRSIGRLEVGTETIVDKSKSVKSFLMPLFHESGNTDIEGIDTTNACYGGTAALFNAVDWLESSSWDGRNAIVVAADIAVYEEGNARPTGGAAAVAMLVTPDAALALEPGVRASHMAHVFDFYKPVLDSEYPLVDGKASVVCYLNALDTCYKRFREKILARQGIDFDLEQADYAIFHSPYAKLVQKSLARVVYNDFLNHPMAARFNTPELKDSLAPFEKIPREETYESREVEKAFLKASDSTYKTKTLPTTMLPKELGNSYTASLYTGLASLLLNANTESLVDKRVLMFSYGSGLAASMFSVRVRPRVTELVQAMAQDTQERLDTRVGGTAQEFHQVLNMRKESHGVAPFEPLGPISTETDLFPGTFYLEGIDERHRRRYARAL
jgi:hydroxymethylglutaryl-CoA synthase